MENITIQLETSIAIALAVSQGWTPTVEDTSQPLDGDDYPQIPNPVTYQDFIAGVAPAYLTEIVKNKGRQNVIDNFKSIYDTVINDVATGKFDAMILSGDIDGIKQTVKDNL